MIKLPFEIRDAFPFIFLNEEFYNIIAWNFWILIFQCLVGIILILYLRRIVSEIQLKSVIRAVREEKPKRKKRKNHKQQKEKKIIVQSAKKNQPRNRKRAAKTEIVLDEPFVNAQDIE